MKNLWTAKELNGNIYHSIKKSAVSSEIKELMDEKTVLKIRITQNRNTPSIDLSDFSLYKNVSLERENRLLINLLELIIFEYAIKEGSCKLNQRNFYGFQEQANWGLVVWDGCRPLIKFVDDPCSENEVKPIISIDSTTNVLYPKKNFLEAVKNFLEIPKSLEEATIIFRGVKLRSPVFPGKIFTFKEFGKPVKEVKDVDIVQLCREKFNVELKNLDEPTAFVHEFAGNFPLELLEIIANQQVPLSSLLETLGEEQTTRNIIKPDKRYYKIMQMIDDLQLQNPITQGFGVTVGEEMIEIDWRYFQSPQYIISEDFSEYNEDEHDYTEKSKFLVPAKIKNCGIIYERKHEDLIKKFVRKIQDTLLRMGIDFPVPSMTAIDSINISIDEWVRILTDLKSNYVMVINEEEMLNDNLELAEILVPKLVVQYVEFDTVMKIEQGDTKECIYFCLDINAINDGVNYRVLMKGIE